MKKILMLLLVGLVGLTGCGKRAPYYRVEVDGGYTYWRGWYPATRHGLCANMYGSDKVGWEVDHPWGVNPENHMPQGTETRIFKTKQEAETWAESVCPTKEAR